MRSVFCFLFLVTFGVAAAKAALVESDICIYGGTAGGIAAAIQSSRMGKSAVIAEFGKHLGGLSSGGLGATDIGNKAAIGGISHEFYRRLGERYGQAEAWKFEPHVAEETFRAMAKEAKVDVYYEQRLRSVSKQGARITAITMENGNVFRAKMFIDCSYEGDLMARAEISYHVGREANSVYGETLNGVRAKTPSHQFTVAVAPYLKAGDPSSGLLPFIQEGGGGGASPKGPGEGDHRVQTYNYRLCFTTNATNRMEVQPPPGYNPAQYELLARYLEALVASGHKPQLKEFWNPIWMPNQKTDINNNGGFSTDFIGASYAYPEGDYATRARICKEHENYTRGFLTFLATSPRVPEDMRREMQTWGPCKDEFQDTGGWPNQLYVREARRMISDYVMTEHNCRGTTKASDSIGLGAYNMDSHNCQRIVKNGRVENEGDVQVPVKPYPISYRSIVPRAAECGNLFVPVCLAASHIAYGSIRMEPVFMILGQSAATAASLAIDAQVPAQQVPYEKLRTSLLADKQILEWAGSTEWRALFNGQNLDNWTQNGSAVWTAKDGIIVGGQDGDPKRSGLLASKEQFKDFELELEFIIDEHGKYNSGIYLRNNSGTARSGYQVNIGRPAAQEFIGLYTDHWLAKGDEDDSIRKKLDWNKLYIFAQGAHIKVRLNGVELFDCTDPAPLPRFLQSGVIGLQTYGAEGHPGWVKFRNIRIRQLN